MTESSAGATGDQVDAIRRRRVYGNAQVERFAADMPEEGDLDGWSEAIEDCRSDDVMVLIAKQCPPEALTEVVYKAASRERFPEGLRAALSRVPLPAEAQGAAMEMGPLARLFLAQSDEAAAEHLVAMLNDPDEYAIEEQALGHRNLPVDVLVGRFDSGDEIDKAAALHNEAMPLEKVAEAAGDDDAAVSSTARYFLGRARLAAGAVGAAMTERERAQLQHLAGQCAGCSRERTCETAVDLDSHSDACLDWHSQPEAWAEPAQRETEADGFGARGAETLKAMVQAALRGEMARRATAAEEALAAVRDVVETWIDAGLEEGPANDAIRGALSEPDAYLNSVLVRWPKQIAMMSDEGLEPELKAAAARWWRDAQLGPPGALAEVLGVDLRDPLPEADVMEAAL